MTAREFLRAYWPLVTVGLTALAILCAAILLFSTMPPRTITMATGLEGGAYYEMGQQYRAALARQGVQLRLVTTNGSLENLALLRDPRSGVSIALIQGATVGEDAPSDIESLGTLFYEPLWLFHRRELHDLTIESLRGRKVSIGPEGSGSRALSLELLKRNGIDAQTSELLPFALHEAANKLL